jgi:AraC-like DNA-binding protein
MRVVPMFRAEVLAPLVRYVARQGDPARIFGKEAANLLASKSLIPLATGGVAFERAARALGSPDLGVRVGESLELGQIGEFAALVCATQTVGAALDMLVRNGARFNTGQRFWLDLHGEQVRLHRLYARALAQGRTQGSDFALTIILKLLRLAAGATWRPSEIHFEGDPPEHAERLAALAEHGTFFRSPQTTLVFSRRLLALPMPEPPAAPPATPGAALPSSEPIVSLRQAIRALMRMGRVDVRDAAAAAGLSVRSLQRHLAAAGLGFDHVLQQERFGAARRLLADRDRKVIDVAVSLGYTDSANFTRAFRRWAGISPQGFRRATLELAR